MDTDSTDLKLLFCLVVVGVLFRRVLVCRSAKRLKETVSTDKILETGLDFQGFPLWNVMFHLFVCCPAVNFL